MLKDQFVVMMRVEKQRENVGNLKIMNGQGKFREQRRRGIGNRGGCVTDVVETRIVTERSKSPQPELSQQPMLTSTTSLSRLESRM